jgi:hypothetical protein
LKLLLDEMFSPLVAAELRARGHDAVALGERDEWQSLPDPEAIVRALTKQRGSASRGSRSSGEQHLTG